MLSTRRHKQQLQLRAHEVICTIESQAARPLQANPTLRKMQPITEVLQALEAYRRQLEQKPDLRELLTINGELAELLYRVNNSRQQVVRTARMRSHLPERHTHPRL